MKILFSEIVHLITKKHERNIWLLLRFFMALGLLVTVYSILFHFIMLYENRNFTWITGFYWTLTVMSTLGFGDITFASDLGKLFSIIVLMSGIVFLLTMLPFTFIQFFYLPWLEVQAKAKAPREVPKETKGHVILTSDDPVSLNLAEKLRHYRHEYVILVKDADKALDYRDLQFRAAVGELDDPATYRRLNAEEAALVVANLDDMTNTNIVFTVREISQTVPIVASADLEDSIDILQLAGSTHVFQFTRMLGQSLARRVLGSSTGANVIGRVESLLIAEAPAMRTQLVGKTIEESRLREDIGINVVGVWERGSFHIPTARTAIHPTTVLLLAGTAGQLNAYDDMCARTRPYPSPVLILGGGRVGRAAGEALSERQIDFRIIEKNPRLAKNDRYILGSAADINTLLKAGIKETPSIIVTMNDDPTNIYLTIYCRRLRPDVQIVCRANQERNISKLHSAGADLVMSYTSMTTNTILGLLRPDDLLMLAEGLNIFRVVVPPAHVGKSLAETHIRSKTGCNVVAICDGADICINPSPSHRLDPDDELVLIGNADAEKRFFHLYAGIEKVRNRSL